MDADAIEQSVRHSSATASATDASSLEPHSVLRRIAFRTLLPRDRAQVQELHEEWFPVRYKDAFYDDLVLQRMVHSGEELYTSAAVYRQTNEDGTDTDNHAIDNHHDQQHTAHCAVHHADNSDCCNSPAGTNTVADPVHPQHPYPLHGGTPIHSHTGIGSTVNTQQEQGCYRPTESCVPTRPPLPQLPDQPNGTIHMKNAIGNAGHDDNHTSDLDPANEPQKQPRQSLCHQLTRMTIINGRDEEQGGVQQSLLTDERNNHDHVHHDDDKHKQPFGNSTIDTTVCQPISSGRDVPASTTTATTQTPAWIQDASTSNTTINNNNNTTTPSTTVVPTEPTVDETIVACLVGSFVNTHRLSTETSQLLVADPSVHTKLFYIMTLGTVLEFRHLKLATLLVQRVERMVQQDPTCGALYLHVITFNVAAIRFYEKLGFFRVTEIQGTQPTNLYLYTCIQSIWNGMDRNGTKINVPLVAFGLLLIAHFLCVCVCVCVWAPS